VLAPVLRLPLLQEHVRQVVLLAQVAGEALEALEVPQALEAADLQLEEVEEAEEAVVPALLAAQKLQIAVPLLLQLFLHALRLASRVLLRSFLAVLPTTPASVSLQLKLA
jgi:hypothetical protein